MDDAMGTLDMLNFARKLWVISRFAPLSFVVCWTANPGLHLQLQST